MLGLISIVIGIIFYFFGATLILPFSFLEVFALVAAYFYNALHANDYERLRVDSQNVYFESKFGLKYREENFLKSLARILPSDHHNLINLSQGQRNIHFGKHIHTRLRSLLEIEIKQALQSWRFFYDKFLLQYTFDLLLEFILVWYFNLNAYV